MSLDFDGLTAVTMVTTDTLTFDLTADETENVLCFIGMRDVTYSEVDQGWLISSEPKADMFYVRLTTYQSPHTHAAASARFNANDETTNVRERRAVWSWSCF